MKTNYNTDLQKWLATLTPDRRRFNFNKVYKVLGRVDKESNFKQCVKQLSINWEVPLTRLTKEQLRLYCREYNQTDSTVSSDQGTTNEEGDVLQVLDECKDDDSFVSSDNSPANEEGDALQVLDECKDVNRPANEEGDVLQVLDEYKDDNRFVPSDNRPVNEDGDVLQVLDGCKDDDSFVLSDNRPVNEEGDALQVLDECKDDDSFVSSDNRSANEERDVLQVLDECKDDDSFVSSDNRPANEEGDFVQVLDDFRDDDGSKKGSSKRNNAVDNSLENEDSQVNSLLDKSSKDDTLKNCVDQGVILQVDNDHQDHTNLKAGIIGRQYLPGNDSGEVNSQDYKSKDDSALGPALLHYNDNNLFNYNIVKVSTLPGNNLLNIHPNDENKKTDSSEINSLLDNIYEALVNNKSKVTPLTINPFSVRNAIDILEENNLKENFNNHITLSVSSKFNYNSGNKLMKDGVLQKTNIENNSLTNIEDYEIRYARSQIISLVRDTLKNINCKNYDLKGEHILDNNSHDKMSLSDESDYESAERGLIEALKFSENDVLPNEIQSTFTNTNDADLDCEDSLGFFQCSFSSKNSGQHCDYSENECLQSKVETTYNINNTNVDSCTFQEVNDPPLNQESHNENNYEHVSEPSLKNIEKINLEENNTNVGAVKNEDIAEVISSTFLKSGLPVECSSSWQQNSGGYLKSIIGTRNKFRNSFDEKSAAKENTVAPLTSKKDIAELNLEISCSKQLSEHSTVQNIILKKTRKYFKITKLKMAQQKIKGYKLKRMANTEQKSKNYNLIPANKLFKQTITSNENLESKINNSLNNKEIAYTFEEKDLMQYWWTNYQYTFSNDKLSPSVYCTRGILDYDDETWPQIHDEPDETPPMMGPDDLEKEEISYLEKEKDITSILQENTSESELDNSGEISGDESVLPINANKTQTNNVPYLSNLDSKGLNSIIASLDFPFLKDFLKQQNVLQVSSSTEAKSFVQEDTIQVQPPLPPYPPPKAPTPPPIPPPVEATLRVSASPSVPLSPFSLPYYVLTQEKISDIISDIPLPPPSLALSPVETEENTTQILKTQETSKPLLSSGTDLTLNKRYGAKLLQSPTSPLNDLLKPRHCNLPPQLKGPTSTVETAKSSVLLSPNFEPRLVISTALPSHELPRLKHSSFSQTSQSNKFPLQPDVSVPRQALSLQKSSSKKCETLLSSKSIPPLILAARSSEQYVTDLIEEEITKSFSSEQPLVCNAAIQEKNECHNKDNFVLCRNMLRKNNLRVIKSWKSNFKYDNKKRHASKKSNKNYYINNIFKAKNKLKKISGKSLLLRKKQILVLKKVKMDVDITSKEQLKVVNSNNFTLQPIGEMYYASDERYLPLEIKHNISPSNTSIVHENSCSYQRVSERNDLCEEEETLIECYDEKPISIGGTSFVICSKNDADISERQCEEEIKNKSTNPTRSSAIEASWKSKLLSEIEQTEACEIENEDNLVKQFVDESIPGDPIACKYVEDEENIEISFEPIAHNPTNIDVKIKSSMRLSTPTSQNKSTPFSVELDQDESNVLNDLDVSSSDHESEEDCYIRPRIINGFGDPFIIPHFSQKNSFSADGKDSVNLTNFIKKETSSTYVQDVKLLSSPSFEKYSPKSKEDTSENIRSHLMTSSKSSDHNLQGSPVSSFSSPESILPIIVETKTIETKIHTRLGKFENKCMDKNTNNIDKVENKMSHLKHRKPSLTPINDPKTINIGTRKNKENSRRFKHKNDRKTRDKFAKNNYKSLELIMPKSMNKTEITEMNKRTQEIIENKSTNRIAQHSSFISLNDKSRSASLNNSFKTAYKVPLHTDGNAVVIKNNVSVKHKKQPTNPQATTPRHEIVAKEKSSYQPSSIRKRLASEVENIIPIKRDQNKPLKTQTSKPIKNIPAKLKRTCSLPEKHSEKIDNPVLEGIFKGMDKSPPPKSFIIKEPESQKYIAQVYSCNQTSTLVGSNQVREPPVRESGVDKHRSSTTSHSCSLTTISNESPLEPKDYFQRSISLDSDVPKKTENKKNPQIKPKKNIYIPERDSDHAPCKVNTTSAGYKRNRCIKHPVNQRENSISQESTPSPQTNSELNDAIVNSKSKQLLRSMPLIGLGSSLDNTTEKQKNINSKTLSSSVPSLVEVSSAATTSTDVKKQIISDTDKNKPSIKVSIPISHFISMSHFHEKIMGVLQPTIKKKKDKCDSGIVSKRNYEIPFNKGDEKCVAYDKRKIRDLPSSLDGKEISSMRKTKRQPQRKEAKQNTGLVERERCSQNINAYDVPIPDYQTEKLIDINPTVITNQKLLPKLDQNEIRQSSGSCLKQISTDSESERPRKRTKLLSADIDNLELCQSDLFTDKNAALPPCLEKQKTKFVLTPYKMPDINFLSTEMSLSNFEVSNPTNPEECEQLNTPTPNLSLLDETNLKVLESLSQHNDLEISIPQKQLNDLNISQLKASSQSCNVSGQSESLTLRVKQPSMLQMNINVDQELQQPTRRISVVSLEALSSAVQSNDQENNKRQTWYMEPENDSSNISSSVLDPKIKSRKTTSVLSSLLNGQNKQTELVNMFKLSIEKGKKKYEELHDVIKCIELDYKQKQDVIERLKKLTSKDVVKQETERATKEYENKLILRESFFRKTFDSLLDNIKGATDYFHLALYVFLSQQLVHLCSETALRDNLLILLKKWIRNDRNKYIFDQNDSDFSIDCKIVLNILSEIENFCLLLSSCSTSMANQSSRNEQNVPVIDFSSNENDALGRDENSPFTLNTNNNNIACTELDLTSDFNLINEVSEPQLSEPLQSTCAQNQSLSAGMESNIEPISADVSLPVRESTPNIQCRTATLTHVTDIGSSFSGNTAQAHNQIRLNVNESPEVQGLTNLPNLAVSKFTEKRSAALKTHQKENTSILENESVLRPDVFIPQENLTEPGIHNNVPSKILEVQCNSQSVFEKGYVPFNEGTNYEHQTQGFDNVQHNVNVGPALRQNNQLAQIPLAGNIHLNTQRPEYTIQHDPPNANYPFLNSLTSHTNIPIDKYQTMRQQKEQSNIINYSSNLLNNNGNVPPIKGKNLARQTDGGNKISAALSYSAPNRGSYNGGAQTGTSQTPVITPSQYSVYPQSMQGIGPSQRHQTQYLYGEYPYISQGVGQAIQPQNGHYIVQSSQQHTAQNLARTYEKSLGWENQNVIQGKVINSVTPEEARNLQLSQFTSNPHPSCNQINCNQKIQYPINPHHVNFPVNAQRQPSHEMQTQFQPFFENQLNMNINSCQSGNMTGMHSLQYPQEQNITHQIVNPHVQRRLSNVEMQNKLNEYSLNHTRQMPDPSPQSSQVLQCSGQNLTAQSLLHRRVSSGDIRIQPVEQPSNHSFKGVGHLRKQYHHQPNTFGNQHPSNRRSSVEIAQPLQKTSSQLITSNSTSGILLATTSMFSEQNMHPSHQNQTQKGKECCNAPLDPTMSQMNSVQIHNRRKSAELLGQSDFNIITEADLNKLFSLVDSEKIIEMMDNIENKSHQPVNQEISGASDTYIQQQSDVFSTKIYYDGTRKTALLNIDNNFKIISQVPDGDLIFNSVNITKEQLLKFIAICKQQVSELGLNKDLVTTFIGHYTTADGRSFTQNEITSLMKGGIAMNAQKITKIINKFEKGSHSILIRTLQAAAFKDFASYMRIIGILKGLAQHNDRDAQQAVQEIANIMRIIRMPEQKAPSGPVVVIDD